MAGDDFAELLRELKERSGLSYGALGKRLHMSASTLHRYVSGEVVPVEFAPVERLARACRATHDELLELHRRWIRADALRGVNVKKTEEAAAPAASQAPGRAREKPEGATAPEQTPASGSGQNSGSERASGSGESSGSERTSGSGQSSGSERASGSEQISQPGGTQPGRAEPSETAGVLAAAGASGTPGASEVPEVFRTGEPTVPRTPRRRVPRAAVYAATGVVAVAAAVALVANLVSGEGGGQHGPVGAAGATVSPSASVSRTATGSASPSESSSSSPSSSHSPSRSASATPQDTGKKPGGAPASGPALTVSTTPYYWDAACEQAFLVDRSPKNVLRPPEQQGVAGWAATLDAVAANHQMTVLTVQGTGADTVVLQNLHVHVVNSKAPLDWTQYAMGVGCGGGANTKSFDVALDQGNPLAMPVAGQQGFPYTVSESDPEVFYVNAHTSDHDVTWYLELEWSSGGRQGVMRIDDNGQPFRTSAAPDKSYYYYPLGESSGWEYSEGG